MENAYFRAQSVVMPSLECPSMLHGDLGSVERATRAVGRRLGRASVSTANLISACGPMEQIPPGATLLVGRGDEDFAGRVWRFGLVGAVVPYEDESEAWEELVLEHPWAALGLSSIPSGGHRPRSTTRRLNALFRHEAVLGRYQFCQMLTTGPFSALVSVDSEAAAYRALSLHELLARGFDSLLETWAPSQVSTASEGTGAALREALERMNAASDAALIEVLVRRVLSVKGHSALIRRLPPQLEEASLRSHLAGLAPDVLRGAACGTLVDVMKIAGRSDQLT